ncbi:HpcH/HpaI aldolase/citrate lyase family protein [Ureibacillus sinduriensis]|uniref:Citrate lyase subunit beta n=1 Tax=Ureibacillus sinduriensis BLB-1 = JCM 15800 TaxID=1384057 RepID=A0A0A3HY19_9BACL|nr:HpcH/HpaI aldolase/citrate lyase family protein [Ureibacillus sinduriensis]KGR76135.1 citrate lyase subunit beta [Ureibacillus sinduriensis BLB-1 = JCM 15800]
MKHFSFETPERLEKIFYKQPESFTKYSEREVLSYMLGATLYMPATKDSIAKDVITKKFKDLVSMVIDLEDAVGDNQLEEAEELLVKHLETIYTALENEEILIEDLPLIFVRVRTPEQLKRMNAQFGVLNKVLTGYVFPKFSYKNGREFMETIAGMNSEETVLYAMPILESSEFIYKEERMESLLKTKEILDAYKEYVLNVRVGCTDFCGLYGIRRNVDTTIYDVSVIRDCLADILNVFNRREESYIISGPVWEYFSKDERILKPQLRVSPFEERHGNTGVRKRKELIGEFLDGLINEVILDKLNGIIGKTIIHPTHIKPVHALYTVTHEEYMDALSIVNNAEGSVGVLKSQYQNKMNEVKPHYYWANRILLRAKAFGVFNEDQDYTSLIIEDDEE